MQRDLPVLVYLSRIILSSHWIAYRTQPCLNLKDLALDLLLGQVWRHRHQLSTALFSQDWQTSCLRLIYRCFEIAAVVSALSLTLSLSLFGLFVVRQETKSDRKYSGKWRRIGRHSGQSTGLTAKMTANRMVPLTRMWANSRTRTAEEASRFLAAA